MITFIIKTFKRKESCEKLVKSIRKFYDYPIIIANDDGEKLKIDGVKIYNLDFDIGLSAGRNFLIKKVKTPYFVLLDDDFIFTDKTDINKFLDLMEGSDLDIIGGALIEKGKVLHYEGTYELENRILKYKKEEIEGVFDIVPRYDFVFNFFIGRTKTFQNGVKWDEDLKLAEHTAFFYDHKGKIKVGYCPDVIVEHHPIRTDEYQKYRLRGKQYMNDFCLTRKLRGIEGMEGNVYKTKLKEDNSKIKEVDFLITTFERKQALENLLFSIAEFYPNANIFIADQNKRFDAVYYRELWDRLMEKDLNIKPWAFSLGYDVGVSKARNFLVKNTSGKYKLILDDDFIFNEKTDIEKFIKVLEERDDVGVVGGAMTENGDIRSFDLNIEIKDGILRQIESENWGEVNGYKVKEVECVLNFALMRKEIFNDVKWCDKLKTTEHTDFFIALKKTKWNVLYIPEVIIEHDHKNNSEEYKKLRGRKEFLVDMMRKNGLKKIIHLNGHVFELKGDKIIQYKI